MTDNQTQESEREAMARIMQDEWHGRTTHGGSERNLASRAAAALIANGFRRQGPVTDVRGQMIYVAPEDLDAAVAAIQTAGISGAIWHEPGPVTDAEVEAAARAIYEERPFWSYVRDAAIAWDDPAPAWIGKAYYRERARAILEAARSAS